LRPARIIAVANAFVAMTSQRADSNAAELDDAVQLLMAEAGKAYDRAVVASLVSHLENHGARGRYRRRDPRGLVNPGQGLPRTPCSNVS
jgi:HD-GYP domain-containing protein (c-di-GMP phosphodiesterase class II)